MDAATSGRNRLVTWWAARKIIDTRFEQVRLNGLLRMNRPIHLANGDLGSADDDFARALFLRIHEEQWKLAIKDLKRALLPQVKRHLYRPVRTINPTIGGKEKVRPRNSKKLAAARRERRRKRQTIAAKRVSPHSQARSIAGRLGRSHHPFNPKTGRGYQKSQPGKGRPKTGEKRKKTLALMNSRRRNAKRRAATEAKRKAAGLAIYIRRGPKERKIIADHKKAHTKRLRAARADWHKEHKDKLADNHGSRFKDDRANHHPELAYMAPNPRQRARKRVKRPFHHRPPSKLRKVARFALLVVRRFTRDETRRKHLRGYWEEVHHLASGRGKKK